MLYYDDALLDALRRVYGDGLKLFLEAVQSPGSRLYARVNALKVSAGEVVDRLRMRGVEVYRDEELEEAIYFPVKGPYRIEVLDKRIVVDKRAAESIYMGANVYAPGVIDCRGVRKGDEVTVVADDGTPVANAIAVADCENIARAGARRGLVAETIRSVYIAPKIRELPEYIEGLIYPQSISAMYVTRVLDPKPGELVVDACAAPGGKTTHIVEYSMGKAHVLAFDHSRKRLRELVDSLKRLGEDGLVDVWRADSRYLHVDFPWIRADRAVVDPPCTDLGVRPKVFDRKSYADVVNASRYQIQFLRSVLQVVKPGGIIVYSTCTVTVEENEEVIERFVEESRCVEVVDIDIRRGSRGVPGYKHSNSFLRFHPHIHDVTGYFIAKLVKKC